jgi:quercetin dioxygenase-like cupin family protein
MYIIATLEDESMRRPAVLLSATFAIGVAVGWFAVKSVSGYSEPVNRTVLLQTELMGAEGQEGVVWLIEIAPGAATGKHYHPGQEFVYVLEGAGRTEVEGKPPVTLKAGKAMYLPPGQVHSTTNASATAPAKALVVYIGAKGRPLVVPAQ